MIGAATVSRRARMRSQSNPVIIPQISPGQLQNLQSRQQRLDFQQRQQINRELDSQISAGDRSAWRCR